MKTRLSVLFVLAALGLSGCFLGGFGNAGVGGIILTLPSKSDVGADRSLVPALDFKMVSFDIIAHGPDGDTLEYLDYGESSLEMKALALGYWTIAVDGKNAAGTVVGQGTGGIDVLPSSVAELTIDVRPLVGKGTLDIDLSIEPGILGGAVWETILRGDGGYEQTLAFIDQDNHRLCGIELDAGFYTLWMRVSIGGIPAWGVEESVVILRDCSTPAVYMLDSPAVNKVPNPPSGLQAVWDPVGKVILRWKDNSQIETGIVVQRSEGGGTFIEIASLLENTVAHIDQGPFTRGAVFSYRITAAHPRGSSLPSTEAAVAIPPRLEVKGKIIKDQIWTSGNEYLVTAPILVEDGVRLRVEPGVVVQFNDPSYYIKVEGTLEALGTAASPVRFMGVGNGAWAGINLTNLSMNNRFIHTEMASSTIQIEAPTAFDACRLSGMTLNINGSGTGIVKIKDSDVSGPITINNGPTVELFDNTLSCPGSTAINFNGGNLNAQGNGILNSATGFGSWGWYTGGTVNLLSNSFKGNGTAVHLQYSAYSITMDANEFLNNSTAIYAYYNAYNWNFINNYFSGNTCVLNFSELWNVSNNYIRNNVFTGNKGDAAILVSNANASLASIVIEGNAFYNPDMTYEIRLASNVRGTGTILNVANNSWGTTDPDIIETKIYDSTFNFELYDVVCSSPAQTAELAAILVSPADGATVCSSLPTLTWKVNGWAKAYKLQLSSTADFTSLLLNLTDLTDRSFKLYDPSLATRMANGGRYYWRIAPIDQNNITAAYSTASSFTIAMPVPALSYPTNGKVLFEGWNPRMEWSLADEITAFQIQVAATSDFGTPIIDAVTAENAYQTPYILPEGRSYYWRVRGRDSNLTWGAFSAVSVFYIPSPGLIILFEDKLPKVVGVELSGPAVIEAAQLNVQNLFKVATETPASSYRWYVNGELVHEDETTTWGSSFGFPVRDPGYYTLAVEAIIGGLPYIDEMLVRVAAAAANP